MESKKLEKPRENGTFSTVQGVMKPDEEGRRVFPTMKPLNDISGKNDVKSQADRLTFGVFHSFLSSSFLPEPTPCPRCESTSLR